jgi:hypothetical protein
MKNKEVYTTEKGDDLGPAFIKIASQLRRSVLSPE